MEEIYYLRENYNQLKRKRYEEYIKKQNLYYLWMKKSYEEYVENEKKYYLDKKKYYEEYLKRKNKYSKYIKKYYEEYIKNQNKYSLDKKKYYEEYVKTQKRYYLYKKKYDKTDITQNEFLNLIKIDKEENNRNMEEIKNNIYLPFKNNIDENKLEYKEDDSEKHNNSDNENCTDIKGSYKKEYLEKKDEEKEFLEEKDEEFLVINNEKYLEKKYEEYSEEKEKEKEKEKEFLEEKEEDKEFLEQDYDNISSEGIFVKLPVILAETYITIPVEATIKLDGVIMEIKEIKNNIFLNKSRLIPFSSSIIALNSGILFIEGFIKKNIQYVAENSTNVETANVYGNIRNCIVEVPFSFTTRIDLLRLPIFIEKTTPSELEFFTNKIQKRSNCRNSAFGRNSCEESFVYREVFNEKPFVELVKVTFIETDIYKNEILNQDIPNGKKFTEITGKTIVNLTLKVLQKQQLKVVIE